MASTYEDFLKTVSTENMDFVTKLNSIFMENDCKVEVKEAKQGYVVSYSYMKDKKKIALMNYVFRKSGMLVRIYARHISMYQNILDTFPNKMKKEMIKAVDCKRLNGISECSPTCTAGYNYILDGANYKKCKNSAFFWLINEESKELIEQMIVKEVALCNID